MPQEATYTGLGALFTTFAALVGVLLLAWALLRWMGKRMPGQVGSRQIKLLDRVAVAPDKCLLLVRVADRTMLVGMSSHSVEKLCDIDDPEGLLEQPANPDKGSFASIMLERMKQNPFSGHKEGES